jgi:hypothetical protein
VERKFFEDERDRIRQRTKSAYFYQVRLSAFDTSPDPEERIRVILVNVALGALHNAISPTGRICLSGVTSRRGQPYGFRLHQISTYCRRQTLVGISKALSVERLHAWCPVTPGQLHPRYMVAKESRNCCLNHSGGKFRGSRRFPGLQNFGVGRSRSAGKADEQGAMGDGSF